MLLTKAVKDRVVAKLLECDYRLQRNDSVVEQYQKKRGDVFGFSPTLNRVHCTKRKTIAYDVLVEELGEPNGYPQKGMESTYWYWRF